MALLLAEALTQGWAPSALAQAPTRVRLDYQRQEAVTCPDASAIQVGVAGRLGYDPFDDHAGESLRVTIRQASHVLEARIEMEDASGKLKAERRLVSRQHDCKELASSVELAISIAIDPAGARPQASVAREPPTSSVASSPPAAPPPDVNGNPPRPSQPLAVDLTAGLVGGIGFAPSPSLGITFGAALHGERLSLGLEGHADLPASKSLRVGSIDTSLLTASLVPCLSWTHVGFCALASAGVLRASGDRLDQARKVSLFYAALGGRIALAYAVAPQWSLTLYGDAVAPLTETTLTVDGSSVWSSSSVAFSLGLGAKAEIP